jgi:integrase/recombinase XerD
MMEMRSWLQTYLAYMVNERRVTRNTELSYYSDLSDFVRNMEANQVYKAGELRAHHITSYLNDLRKEGRTSATITRRIVSIRSFCKYLTIHREIDYNPALQLETPKADKKPLQALSTTDLDKLLELPDTSYDMGLRDRAMLELLYATGLRVTELISLDIEHVRLDMGFLLCLGSGGRERMVPVGSQGTSWVSKYLEKARPRLVHKEKPNEALFVNHLGTRFTRQGFWKVMKKYASQLGIDITPHTFRHSFATHLLDNGADIRAVQEMLGHVDPSTTHKYLSSVKLKIKEEYERNHPRART